MKVKFIQHLATPNGNYPVGAIMEVTGDRAKQLQKDGVVEEYKGELKATHEDRTLLPNGVMFEEPSQFAPAPAPTVLPNGVAIPGPAKARHKEGTPVDHPDSLTAEPVKTDAANKGGK